MSVISAELVQETWQEIAAARPKDAQKIMGDLADRHVGLMAFVSAYTQKLRPEATELAIYMLVVIYRIFKKSFGRTIRKITPKMIERRYDQNMATLEILDGAQAKFLVRTAQVQTANQPFVYKYIAEALMEGDVEDDLVLNEEEMGKIFIVLKTCVELLDEATSEQPE